MIVRLPKEFLSVISQNNGLKQYLNNLLVGKEFTDRSWLYESEEPDTILKHWMQTLSQLESGNPFEVRVYQFDTSQVEKWGPQGGVKPVDELMETLLAGFTDDSQRPTAFSSKAWLKAKRLATRDFAGLRLSLRPASYYKVVDDMRARDTLESNSGWPLFTRRNKPDVIEQAVNAAHSGQWKTYPAIALFRNYNNKTRLVWMFPMAANVKEGSYLQPLQSGMINLLQKDLKSSTPAKHHWLQYFTPWIGFEEVRKQIDHTYKVMADEIAASDFSATDAHFTKWHTLEVFDVIQVCFQPEYHKGLKESLLAMHNIPLIIGPDKMITGTHGVSSGSNWTNFVETIFDYIFSIYVWELSASPGNYDTDEDWNGLCGIGDDMSWSSFEGEVDAFPAFLEQAAKDVGHEANAEKTNSHEGWVKFLQRLFQRGYNRDDGMIRAVYPTIRALKSSVYPEKFHDPKSWNSDMFCARQYMILENCVDHPLFKDFVAFIVKGQKDLIPFAFKTASELDRIHRESKLIPGLNPTYNQEKRERPLSEFDSIKTVRELFKTR